MIKLPARDASALASIASSGPGLNEKMPRTKGTVYDLFYQLLTSNEAKKVAETLKDLFLGKDVPQSRRRDCALGMIAWAFTNHTWAHRNAGSVRSTTGGNTFNYPTALQKSLRCRCANIPKFRKVLKKYGEFEKIKNIANGTNRR